VIERQETLIAEGGTNALTLKEGANARAVGAWLRAEGLAMLDVACCRLVAVSTANAPIANAPTATAPMVVAIIAAPPRPNCFELSTSTSQGVVIASIDHFTRDHEMALVAAQGQEKGKVMAEGRYRAGVVNAM
jgi:hypothetical protein